MAVTSNELAILRTKYANQRTYLAYMRTGFGIAALAGTFKHNWLVAFGICMIVGSSVQYINVNSRLQDTADPNSESLDMLPLIYTALSILVLYIQYTK
jgi:uncharacterized membrane protein YidH (DUF202 family)